MDLTEMKSELLKTLITQNELATRANVNWHDVLQLVATGLLKPAARGTGKRLLFSERDVKAVRRAVNTQSEVEATL